MGKVLAVCVSEAKGTEKANVNTGKFLKQWGIENDAHAGNWHRQVSLISADKVEAFKASAPEVEIKDGAFGENLVVEGIDFSSLPIGTKFKAGDVLLEMTQIGKECHHGCAIRERVGDCIMPREGVFAVVLEEGTISVGDDLVIVNV